jgi:hypothetical protein
MVLELDRLFDELTCLAPVLMAPHERTVLEAIPGDARRQPDAGPDAGAAVPEARPAVVARVGG